MAPSQWLKPYQLTVTTCSPLHIGSGGPNLRRGIDFVAFNRMIYVFDTMRMLDYVLPESDDKELLESVTNARNLATFVQEQDFRQHPDLLLYRLFGGARVEEVQPQIKDASYRPYLPGSSLKGALRTAIIDMALLNDGYQIDVRRLEGRAKFAGREIEQEVAGRGPRPHQAPNYDLFRALHIADSQPVMERDCLRLCNVAVWASSSKPSIPIDVETVAQDTVFATEMTLDTHLFAQSQLGLSEKRGLLENMAEACRTRASQRIEQELDFFTRRNLQPLQRFYEGLRAQLQQCGPQSFLIQIGWGSGWGSKTIEQTLRANDGAIPAAVRRYKLDRGRGRGDDFPATRHLVLDQQQQRVQRPVEPLGWVKVEINEETTP